VIIGWLVTGAAGFVLLPTAPFIGGLIVAMALLGVAGAADSVAPGAVMGDVVAGGGGTVVAVFQMAGDLGAVIGPVAAGWIADAHGYGATFFVSAAVSLAPIPAVLRAPETLTKAPVPSVAPA
jgi:MFS family permease